MSDQGYNRIANVLMLVGIASALAFDSGKVPHVVAGTVGIVAGVSAMLLYFCSSKEAAKKEDVKEVGVVSQVPAATTDATMVGGYVKTAAADEIPVYGVAGAGSLPLTWSFWESQRSAIEAYRPETAQLWLSHYALHHARRLRWGMIDSMGAKALLEPEVELSPNEVAACAVEIIRTLAISDEQDHWEYAFGPKGLRIALRRSSPMHAVTIPQEDLDFGDVAMGYKVVQ